MPRDLLIEIGVEELPASFLRHALEGLESVAGELFAARRLVPESGVTPLGTPRRLALMIAGVPDRQPDRHETVIGPPWSVAVDADGAPTKAGEGFARKQGADPAALRSVTTEKGEYAAVDVHEQGRPALEVLPDLLTELCKRIPFPKSMRWGEGEIAFGRPVHWLVGLLDAEIVPFELAGLTAGRTSRGHRFLAPAPFEIERASDYVGRLREAHVWVDFNERRESMRRGLEAAAKEAGGELLPDAFLMSECLSLVEEPHVVPGRFDPRFLALPAAVVVSVMRDHQRYFAVRDESSGELLPAYLNVVNTANAPETIAKGNDRVLRARLRDAEFFVVEDRKVSLEERLPRLDHVVFQAKLGSVGDKVRRVAALAEAIAKEVDGVTTSAANRAAKLSKTDLETLIVGEFPELQGQMGRYYAEAEGIDADVALAIEDHYKPQGANDDLPREPLGAVVAVADRADTLVGCFGVGLEPSGSADPFALRRATLGLLRIALEGPIDVDAAALFERAFAEYGAVPLADKADVLAKLSEFVRGRVRAFYRERHPGDLVDACVDAWHGGSLRDLDARIRAVAELKKRPEYDALAVAFKRAHNITKDTADAPYDRALLEEGAEARLSERFEALRPKVEEATSHGEYDRALTLIAEELREPIDRFFDDVFVMVDDEKVRKNRLRMLRGIAATVTRIVHFHQLST